jgi:small subunit ribosomal protein S21
MRLARAPEVVEAEEAQVVGAAVDEDAVAEAGVVGGVLGKRASGITESYYDVTHTLVSGSQNPPNYARYDKKGDIGLREFSSLEVKVVGNDLERAMKILKRKLQKDGVFRRLKAKRSYEKPSECRRRKRRESERRQRIDRLKRSRGSRY